MRTVHTLDQLLKIICNDGESTGHMNDLYFTMQQYEQFSDRSLSQAAYLSEKPQFRNWLLGSGSATLLVDGHCGEHLSHRMSPLSIFCTTLIQSLLDLSHSSQDIVLHFFCGQHLDPTGSLYGPQGLIRSLTAQLILELWTRQLRPDFHFLADQPKFDGHTYPEDIDVRAMCQVFVSLLGQLPPGTTVYCVMDGISQFETTLGNWSEELRVVVACLQWCGENPEGRSGVSMKSLFASADASTVIRELVSLEEQVDLSSGEYYGSVASPGVMARDLAARTFV